MGYRKDSKSQNNKNYKMIQYFKALINSNSGKQTNKGNKGAASDKLRRIDKG